MMFCASIRMTIALLLSTFLVVDLVADGGDPQPLATVKAKPFQRKEAVAAEAMPAMIVANRTPPATLPAELLPQYRVGYQRSDSLMQGQANHDAIRFVLSDATILDRIGRPLLVDITMVVGDKHVAALREHVAEIFAKTSAVQEPPVQVDAVQDTEEKPAVIPATIAAYRLTTESQELMRRYAEAIGEPVQKDEAAWLMTHWTEGPSLLVLHPYYQNFRAQQTPVFDLLDQNRDGTLSPSELAEASAMFLRCDTNRDGIVDVLEIEAAAKRLRDPAESPKATAPLLWMLSDLVGITQADATLFQSLAAFDTNQDGQIDSAEVTVISKQAPDLRVRVTFSNKEVEASKLEVLSVNSAYPMQVAVDSRGEGINVSLDGLTLHVSAIESAIEQNQASQVSVGAVVDGYPLLPELDPNVDGRFTVRELRTLTQRLLANDRNGDQMLTRDECLSPIRLCIGRGGIVHEELANLRNVVPETTSQRTAGPEWFMRMDRNQDGDLTRDEFPGTDEQFAALDADGDSLVSAAEANAFEKQTDE